MKKVIIFLLCILSFGILFSQSVEEAKPTYSIFTRVAVANRNPIIAAGVSRLSLNKKFYGELTLIYSPQGRSFGGLSFWSYSLWGVPLSDRLYLFQEVAVDVFYAPRNPLVFTGGAGLVLNYKLSEKVSLTTVVYGGHSTDLSGFHGPTWRTIVTLSRNL